MKAEVKHMESARIIRVDGQIRISTQNEFKDLLDGMVKSDEAKSLILNLSGVSYMNSAGLGIIIDTYKKLKLMNCRLILCELMPDIKKLFEVTKLNKFIEIFSSEVDAINSVSAYRYV